MFRLANAYENGALAAGMEVEKIDLGAIDFDLDVHPVSPRDQPLEPDLKHALQLIKWADQCDFYLSCLVGSRTGSS